ncbi:hypothetical protein [uncultured Caulobacter sp.]|uniref:hypothetical protein n=1 Tax=uncultured Caulobacter sp. TaxID=158749 RepID=UPI0026022C54|nr:hypothetical protein [uncultured Caulobacter sp.]
MKTVMFALAALCLAPAAASAATSPKDLCPNGQLVTIRFSEIKPTGTKAGFAKAAADNQAWYVSHGLTQNHQNAGVVLQRNDKGEWTESPNAVVTVHTNPPGSTAPAPDDAWKAFVAEYDANSTMKSQTMVCFSQPLR